MVTDMSLRDVKIATLSVFWADVRQLPARHDTPRLDVERQRWSLWNLQSLRLGRTKRTNGLFLGDGLRELRLRKKVNLGSVHRAHAAPSPPPLAAELVVSDRHHVAIPQPGLELPPDK